MAFSIALPGAGSVTMAILIDPPSPFAPTAEWQAFLAEMETLVAKLSQEDALLVRNYIEMAKQELPIPLNEPPFKCPMCKQKTGVSITYGFPTEEAFEQAERSEAVLGGCMQEIGAPDRQCLSCGHQWEIVRRNTSPT